MVFNLKGVNMDKWIDYLKGNRKLLGIFETDDSVITVKSAFDKVYIEANRQGLICLAKYLIYYAYDEKEVYPDSLHLYCSNDFSGETLSENSEELIIKKID